MTSVTPGTSVADPIVVFSVDDPTLKDALRASRGTGVVVVQTDDGIQWRVGGLYYKLLSERDLTWLQHFTLLNRALLRLGITAAPAPQKDS